MAKATATTHAFHLKLEGSPGSGKSTFLKFVMLACHRSDYWHFVRSGPHSMEVTHVRPPVPKEDKNGI